MEVLQLTYARHCDGIYGAREAAETDVVVLLKVRRGLEVANSPGENRWAGHGISAAAIGQSRLPLLQLLLPSTKDTLSPYQKTNLSCERTQGLARPII